MYLCLIWKERGKSFMRSKAQSQYGTAKGNKKHRGWNRWNETVILRCSDCITDKPKEPTYKLLRLTDEFIKDWL